MTYEEIAQAADVSINSVYTCQMNKNMQLRTYLKQLNCYLHESHYRFDFIRLNRLLPACATHGKTLVVLEVSDEELTKYVEEGAIVLGEREG